MILFYKTYPGSGGYKIKFHVIFNQCCISISPENVKKPLVFLRFQGILKWNTGMKGAIFYLLLLVSLSSFHENQHQKQLWKFQWLKE